MHTVGEAPSSVPAFLGKLWKLVEDPSTNHLISWNPNGLSFTIRDQARFARELLPLYYKHNNMASFVRQLNMYGFHKVVSVDSGGLKVDKDEMEFAHTYFLQGQEFLLEHIKRKIPVSKQDDSKHNKPEVLSRVLAEVRSVRGKQENVDSKLVAMKRENEALWREVASLRQKHMKQQQIVNKLIQFLISIVQPNGHAGLSHKRRYPLMLREARSNSTSSNGKEAQLKDNLNDSTRLKNLYEGDLSNEPAISVSSGPIIHDVTDIEEDSIGYVEGSNEDDEQEVVLDEKGETDETPLAPNPLTATNITVAVVPDDSGASLPVNESMEEELDAEQPDFDSMAQIEPGTSGSGTGIIERAMMASPLSPDLMLAVDPREVNAGALLSFEESRKGKDVGTGRGKSMAKKQENTVAVTECPRLDKEGFDSHLDAVQMDLDQLREVLSLQGSPIDASTLLGLFSADDALSGGYFPSEMDLFRNPIQGTITGNEVIAYNSSTFLDDGNEGDIHFLEQGETDVLLKSESVEKESPDLFDLLAETPAQLPVEPAPSAAKKKKRN